MLSIIFTLLFSNSSIGTDYECATEFGETVPVRTIVLKKNVSCSDCSMPGHLVDKALVDKSTQLNPYIETDSTISSKVKRRVFQHAGHTILMDTRYAKRKGPKFNFQLTCSGYGKCESFFIAKDGSLLPKDTVLKLEAKRVYDRRLSKNAAHVSIGITRRKLSGFLVRVFKDKIPVTKGLTMQTSSSGEIKFFQEQAGFSMDAGADEQIELMSGFRTRIAAFEIKIVCSSVPAGNTVQ